MKRMIFLLMIVFAVACFAVEQKLKFSPDTTLLEISAQTNIPVKKIAQYLKINDQTKFTHSIQELEISNDALKKAIAEYNNNKLPFYSGIIIMGMGIVFVSLLIVGLIIGSLQHIGDPKKIKKKVVQTPVGKITVSQKHISSNGIVAAITAMFLHDAEEKDKLNLTWKRQTISLWQAAGMVENKNFEDRRGR